MRWAQIIVVVPATIALSACATDFVVGAGASLVADTVVLTSQEQRAIYCQAESGAVYRYDGTSCHTGNKLVSRATYDAYQIALTARYCLSRGVVRKAAPNQGCLADEQKVSYSAYKRFLTERSYRQAQNKRPVPNQQTFAQVRTRYCQMSTGRVITRQANACLKDQQTVSKSAYDAYRLKRETREGARVASPQQQQPSTNEQAYASDLVRRVQRALTGLGYQPGPVDGFFGVRTQAAIRAFQVDKDIPSTGEISLALRAELAAATAAKADVLANAPSISPPEGQKETPPLPDLVKRIQSALAALGYFPGPANGIISGRTSEAISSYQANNNLPATGEPSPTLARLLDVEMANSATATPPQKAPTMELTSNGSGFFVNDKGYLLTNQHVIDGCGVVRIRQGEETNIAKLVAADELNDLALLSVDGTETSGVTFRDGPGIRPGDDVVALGFPLQGLLASSVTVTTGIVSNLAGIGDNRAFLQITAPVQPGNSGGPLLDNAGNLVGVIVAKLNAITVAGATGDIPQNVNFAVNATLARIFLDSEGTDYRLARSTEKLPAADIAARARQQIANVECWNLTQTTISP